MSSDVETGRITTDIPARLDRLPWARWHWMVVIGLGTGSSAGWLADAPGMDRVDVVEIEPRILD